MTILGIDPGAHGAIAVLDDDGELLEVLDMPSTPEANGRTATNAPLLAVLLSRAHARIAFCEFVGARPTDAKVAAFAFGLARGVIEGCAGALGLPIVFLTPPTWKRLADIPPGAENKDLARSRAIVGAGAKAPPHEKEPPEIKGAKADPGANAPPGAADGTERDVASITVEVGGVVHLGHYSTRNGMIRVTYGSSCQATQLGGMENAPKALARIILAEQAREALGHNEAED